MPKVFVANPLALSVPDPVFETWLRDSGYLEVLDERTTTAATDPSPPPSSSATAALLQSMTPAPSAAAITVASAKSSSFARILSFFRTLAAVLTLNPFAMLTPDDLSGGTPSWTLAFIGGTGSYSWPAGPSQARMRVRENVRRYARNYAFLVVLFFACSLYQMPVSLLGVIASLVIWELLRFCGDLWELEQRRPVLRQALARLAQFATAVILYLCKLQLALIYALSISYSVMILHASLRKLTPSKQNRDKRPQQKKVQFTAK